MAASIPAFMVPAGAAATGCGAGEFPATFAAQSGLKVDCNTNAGDNVANLEIHDADNVAWHHGAARTAALACAAAPCSTTAPAGAQVALAGSATIKWSVAGLITANDIRRPISAFTATHASIFKGGTFITAVTGNTATLSQTAALTAASATVRIDYTTSRFLVDGFCTAKTETDTIGASPHTTVAAVTTHVTTAVASFPAAGFTLKVTAGTIPNFPATGLFPSTGSLSIATTTPTATDKFTYATTNSGLNEFLTVKHVAGQGTGTKIAVGAAVTLQVSANHVTTLHVASTSLTNFTPTGTFTVPEAVPAGTATYSYTGITATTLTGLTLTSSVPAATNSTTIAAAAAVTETNVNVTAFNGTTGLNMTTASATTNGFTAPTSFPAGNLTVETSSGQTAAVLSFTGATATAFTGVSFVSGSGTISPSFAVVGSTAAADTTLTSASAHFVATDVGKSVSAGPFLAGTFVTSVNSLTSVQLSEAPARDCSSNNGGNPGSPHPIQSLTAADSVELGAATYSGGVPQAFNSDPMNLNLSNTTGGGQGFTCTAAQKNIVLTAGSVTDTGGFTSTAVDSKLPVTVKGTTTVATTIVSVTSPSTAVLAANCPAGIAATTGSAIVGAADSGAPVTNAPMMTLGAILNLNPALVGTEDDCANATYEGFEVVGGWVNPGTFSANTSTPKASVAQVSFPTSVLSFNGFVVPKMGGDTIDANPHYNFSFPILPTSLAVCLNDTPANGGSPTDATQLAFGMNPTTLSAAPFLPTGSGSLGDPTVRSLLPETGAFHQTMELLTSTGAAVGSSPFTGATCTIQPDTTTPGIACGDG